MTFIDLFLIVIVSAFVFFGLFFGLMHTLGSLIGTVVAIFFAGRLIDGAFHSFGFIFGGGSASRIILFIIIFFLISRLVGIVFWFFGRMWGMISWIPFAKSIDRLLGALFGFVEGIIVVGIILFYAMQVLPPNFLRSLIEASFMAKFLMATAGALQVFLPQGMYFFQNKK